MNACRRPLSCVLAVLFDLDGTLIDSAPDLAAAANKMRVERGLPSLPLKSYRHMAGSGARGMIAVAFGLVPEDVGFEQLKHEFFVNYEACLTHNTHAFAGVPELIAGLRQKSLVWGVVTNKAARFSEPLARSMPFFANSTVLISGDTTAHSKPHPAPLLEAARRIGIDPARCVYVGDDERDIIAGKAAGMLTVAATYGYLGTQADPFRWSADAEIKSPLALLDLLMQA